jgi:hypothetical protein
LAPRPGQRELPRRRLPPHSRCLPGRWRAPRSTPARDHSSRHWSRRSSRTSSPWHRGTARTSLGPARQRSPTPGGSLLTEPGDDSSPAEAPGSLIAEVRRAGSTLRAAAPVLAETTYAVVAPHRSRGNCDPETERSPVGVAVVSSVGASRRDAARAACWCSVRACRERCPERRRRRGAEGPAASVLAGVDPPAVGAKGPEVGPVCRHARSSSRLVIRMR